MESAKQEQGEKRWTSNSKCRAGSRSRSPRCSRRWSIPKSLSHYFTTGGAKGRLETGATVTWDFHDFPGAFPVKVVDVVPNKRIVLNWGAGDDAPEGETLPTHDTTVTMEFEALEDGRTLVSISEEGWRETREGSRRRRTATARAGPGCSRRFACGSSTASISARVTTSKPCRCSPALSDPHQRLLSGLGAILAPWTPSRSSSSSSPNPSTGSSAPTGRSCWSS